MEEQMIQERISAVLTNPQQQRQPPELIELINETEAAITAAESNVMTARERAADVIACPTPLQACDAMKEAEAAELELARLRGALPKLKDRLAEALRTDRIDRWLV